jgi:hypothetical protein
MSERDAFIESMEDRANCGRPQTGRWPRGSHDYSSKWIDALVARRENSLERMLREKLAVPEGEDLLQAALTEQFLRNKFNMHDLIVE